MGQRYWWVNHSMTFKAESEDGYIWSPKTKQNSAANTSYTNLTLTKPGDLVFSYARSHIRAVGVVTAHHVTQAKPKYSAPGAETWADDGWYVKIDWLALEHPVAPRDHMDLLAPLLPERHSPIQTNGRGNQGVYLAAISNTLGMQLLELLDAQNRGVVADLPENISTAIDESIEQEILHKPADGTDRMQVSLARRGQGLFRRRVADIEAGCRVTGVTKLALLTASHIKPWQMSTDDERLDGANGLLLAPHVDRLFDRGYITFEPSGQIKAANDEIRHVLMAWGIDQSKIIKLRPRQEAYMAFHRVHVFDKPPRGRLPLDEAEE